MKYWYRIISNVLTMAFMVVDFAWIWYRDLNPLLYTSFLFKGNFLVIGAYGCFVLLFVRSFGGFKINVYNMLNIVISQVTAWLCAAAVQFFFVFILIGRVKLIPTILLSFTEMYIVQLVFCIICSPIIITIFNRIFEPYNILLIYGKDADGDIQIEKQNHNYVIRDRINCDDDIKKIKTYIDANDMVLIDEVTEDRRAFLLRLCFEKKKKVLFAPTVSNIIINGAQCMHLLDSPLCVCRDVPLSLHECMMKRCGDVLLSILGIIILSPIMILTSLAIFLYDRGPVFYRQTRYTLDGKIFRY